MPVQCTQRGLDPERHIFAQVKAAFEAVTKLHGTALAGHKQRQSSSGPLWARQLKGEGAMVKKWRLILRNLPFHVRSAAAYVLGKLHYP